MQSSPAPKTLMESEVHLTRTTVSNLLTPAVFTVFEKAEDRHPWRASVIQHLDKPLLRLWDHYSGSQLEANGSMKAREERGRLDTAEAWKSSLTIHINNRCWVPTPYISFTTSPLQIEKLARTRPEPRRGPHILTVIDPGTRLKNGLPIIHVAREMEHYGIINPYWGLNEIHEHHYACLWEVNPEEIVGHWQWDDLVKHSDWYHKFIEPAVKELRKKTVQPDNLSNLFTGLSLATDPSDSINFSGRSASLSEESTRVFDAEDCDDPDDTFDSTLHEDASDTDDEVEEANAIDDALKLMAENK